MSLFFRISYLYGFCQLIVPYCDRSDERQVQGYNPKKWLCTYFERLCHQRCVVSSLFTETTTTFYVCFNLHLICQWIHHEWPVTHPPIPYCIQQHNANRPIRGAFIYINLNTFVDTLWSVYVRSSDASRSWLTQIINSEKSLYVSINLRRKENQKYDDKKQQQPQFHSISNSPHISLEKLIFVRFVAF